MAHAATRHRHSPPAYSPSPDTARRRQKRSQRLPSAARGGRRGPATGRSRRTRSRTMSVARSAKRTSGLATSGSRLCPAPPRVRRRGSARRLSATTDRDGSRARALSFSRIGLLDAFATNAQLANGRAQPIFAARPVAARNRGCEPLTPHAVARTRRRRKAGLPGGGHGDRRVDDAASLAAGEYRGRTLTTGRTCFGVSAALVRTAGTNVWRPADH